MFNKLLHKNKATITTHRKYGWISLTPKVRHKITHSTWFLYRIKTKLSSDITSHVLLHFRSVSPCNDCRTWWEFEIQVMLYFLTTGDCYIFVYFVMIHQTLNSCHCFYYIQIIFLKWSLSKLKLPFSL